MYLIKTGPNIILPALDIVVSLRKPVFYIPETHTTTVLCFQ